MSAQASVLQSLQHKIVSETEWLAARKQLLAEEKEFTRLRDSISAKRRELPWVRVETNYAFAGPNGKVSLSDLFRGKSQLIVYHFMFGPDWTEGCPSCSYLGDHFGGCLVHLDARDVAFTAISRAPMPQIAAFKKRMGWGFQWVSSNANSFNLDYHVSFTPKDKVDGKVNLLRHDPIPKRRGARCHLLQKCCRRNLSHLLQLRPRLGYLARHVQLSGHDP
jgi:predicted dithiol-disulfide oxidoreductase (DUF899 family)